MVQKRIKAIYGKVRETGSHCILVKLLGLLLISQLVC
jgi:hypothetical protein